MSTDQTENFETSIDIPDKVTVTLKKNMLAVSGPLGKTFKNFRKIPVSLEVKDNNISIKTSGNRKKEYAILNTATSLIRNLCEGVIDGYTIKMKVVYAHFPITVKNKDHRVFLDGIYIYSKSKGIEK